jgi:serine/threonine-protein kinase
MSDEPRPAPEPDSGDATRTSDGRNRLPAVPVHQWGDLHLLAEIGAGGFGRVYRARDPNLARDVALKIVTLESKDQAAVVLREGRMLARVRHRNIVTVYAAQRIGDEVGLTMELVDGQHLGQVVRGHGPMGAEEAAVIGINLCQALAAVHAVGLVHRDVKTRNVMREAGGRIVLMDFGAGRDAGDVSRGSASDLSGTPLYMAPELFQGHPASSASDLYSLGVLLFYLVTGQYPVQAPTPTGIAVAHLAGERRLLSDVRPDLPIAFVRVVERALSRDPDERYPSAGAMMTALAEAIPGVSIPSPAIDPGRRDASADEQAGRRRRPAAAAAARVAAGLGAAVLTVGALGLIMSAAFDKTLGRDGSFSDDTVLDWWIYGVRSLIPLAVYTILTLIVAVAVRAVWRLVRPSLRRRASDGDAGTSSRSLERFVLVNPSQAAQALLILQGVALVAVLWFFRDVWSVVFAFAGETDREALRVLSRTSDAPILYRQALSVTLVVSVLAWYALLKRRAAREAIDIGTKIGGGAIAVVMLLMLEAPYRLMFQNDHPVVGYEDQLCFELGRRPSGASEEVLVYCPDWPPPRIGRVQADGVSPTGREGDLFSDPRAR